MENSSPNPSFSICDIRIQKQISRSFGKSFPPKIVLPKLRPHWSPTHCPNTWRAEPRKKNTLSFFKKNFTPAKSEMQGVFFLSGLLAYSPVRGAFSERTGQFQATTHAERAKSLPHFVLEIGASLVQYRQKNENNSLRWELFSFYVSSRARIWTEGAHF